MENYRKSSRTGYDVKYQSVMKTKSSKPILKATLPRVFMNHPLRFIGQCVFKRLSPNRQKSPTVYFSLDIKQHLVWIAHLDPQRFK